MFTKVGFNDTPNTAGLPDIGPVTVSFTANEQPSPGTFIAGDTKTVVKESANFIPSTQVWGSGVGIYRYQVSEIASGITIPPGSDREGALYSTARYNVEIWVDIDANNLLFAKYVVVRTVTGFIDEYYEGTPGGEKVDPTPGGTNTTPVTSVEDAFSHFIFTNRYWKTDGEGTTDPDLNALRLNKHVVGLNADPNEYFRFDVTVTQSSVIPGTQRYIAFVFEDNGTTMVKVIDRVRNPMMAADGSITFTSGTQIQSIQLKGGQSLVFFDLHIGSAVAMSEQAAPGYIPSYIRSFAGTTGFTGVASTAFGFPRTDDPGPHYTIAGQNTNRVDFTNTRSGATPGGISVDDLPYIVLIAVAVFGIAGFLVIKHHRSTKYE